MLYNTRHPISQILTCLGSNVSIQCLTGRSHPLRHRTQSGSEEGIQMLLIRA